MGGAISGPVGPFFIVFGFFCVGTAARLRFLERVEAMAPPPREAHAEHGDLERFRGYLRVLARVQLSTIPESKVDLSGVVQQTLWEASQALGSRAVGAGELPAWLRTILARNLQDEVRKACAARRDVGRERSVEELLRESSARLESWLATDTASPDAAMVREEQLLRLAEALEELPPDQRTAVELRHLAGLGVAEVATQMERSPAAVGQLLVRGLRRLRAALSAPED